MKRPVRILSAIAIASSIALSGTFTTASAQPRPFQGAVAVPDDNTLARLVWTTLIAVDNANRTGRYAVLHNLGTAGFQQRNSVADLYRLFSPLRENRVDVGRTVLSSPVYYQPPSIMADGSLRLRGGFDFRPKSVRFDLIYEIENGGWQLSAISVVETDFNAPR